MDVYVNVDIRPLTISNRYLATHCHSYMVNHHFCPVADSLLSKECWFPQLPQRRICIDHSAISRHCMQITISNQSGNHTNQYSACNYWKYRSVLKSWVSSEGEVKNYWSVTRCRLKRHTLCSWEQHSYPTATWVSIEGDHIKRRSRPFLHHEAKEFSLTIQDQGGADQANWTR